MGTESQPTDSVVNYLKSAIAWITIGDRASAQVLVEYARNALFHELGPLKVRVPTVKQIEEWDNQSKRKSLTDEH